jgi:YD repeat-containing protein
VAQFAWSSGPGLVLTVIAYRYDPLGRLTDAEYSDGKQFHYLYDAAGNRTQAS